jgi:hypothetical protein
MPETKEMRLKRMADWAKQFPRLMAAADRHEAEHGTPYQQALEKAAENDE